MARLRTGILMGALAAVGGMLVWQWTQKQRASQVRLARELNRWEGEGGSLAPGVAPPLNQAAHEQESARHTLNVERRRAGARPWPYPRS
ncbi:hypothetical protein [Paraburkholderia hayleyella]|uniref:hypothetical protein n=1 Tax=Paraburkholderia hayleyella TaxID=2152889 RepID=UPI001291156D|nr:hypothetical protein [Paraburkholderia hayleyella]